MEQEVRSYRPEAMRDKSQRFEITAVTGLLSNLVEDLRGIAIDVKLFEVRAMRTIWVIAHLLFGRHFVQKW